MDENQLHQMVRIKGDLLIGYLKVVRVINLKHVVGARLPCSAYSLGASDARASYASNPNKGHRSAVS